MKYRQTNRIEQGESLTPLVWAEQNLSALSKFSARKMNGTEADTFHLGATFALLKARQQIRQGIREVELLRREVSR